MSDTNDSQKIIDCPHCGKAISATSEKCPYCQKAIELQPEQPKENDTGLKKYNIKKILLVAYIVTSVFTIFGLSNYSSSLETRNGKLREKVSSYEEEIGDWKSENKELKDQLAEIEDYKVKYNEVNSKYNELN